MSEKKTTASTQPALSGSASSAAEPAGNRSATRASAALGGGGVDAEIARIIEQAQAGGLQLTGEGGLLPGMIRQAVEAALHAEMTDHLGYERHAAEGRRSCATTAATSACGISLTRGVVGAKAKGRRA